MSECKSFCRTYAATMRDEAIKAGVPPAVLARENHGTTGSRNDFTVEFVDNGNGKRETFHSRTCCKYAAFANALDKMIARRESPEEFPTPARTIATIADIKLNDMFKWNPRHRHALMGEPPDLKVVDIFTEKGWNDATNESFVKETHFVMGNPVTGHDVIRVPGVEFTEALRTGTLAFIPPKGE